MSDAPAPGPAAPSPGAPTSGARLRVVLVDDEPLALRGLAFRLAAHADVDVIGKCDTGRDAVEVVTALRPDVVFLDVQMPGLDGFGVLAALPAEARPLVVFVTAYDRYAVAAFEAHALDYLLKPLDPDRLAETLVRIRAHRDREARLAHADRLRALLDAWPVPAAPVPPPARLLVRTPGKLISVPAERVRWVEAVGDYARLHLDDGRTPLLRETLTALEARLDPQRFVRLHRSTLVAVDELREIRALGHGDALAVLHDGTTRRIGRAYRAALEERLGRRR